MDMDVVDNSLNKLSNIDQLDEGLDGQQLSFSLPRLARIRRLKRHQKFEMMRKNRSED